MLLGMTKRWFCVVDVLETTWNDNDSCLNIVMGSKVADTTFTVTILCTDDGIKFEKLLQNIF